MAARKASHGHVCSSDQTVKLVGFEQIEGMMGDDDARAILPACLQSRATPGDLLAVNAAILKGERAGGIDTHDRDFLIGVEGLEVLADVALVIPKGSKGAGKNVVQRHVVIARDDNLRGRERVQEFAGFLKLALFRALGKIPGNDDDVRPGFGDDGDQGINSGWLDAAEMKVR